MLATAYMAHYNAPKLYNATNPFDWMELISLQVPDLLPPHSRLSRVSCPLLSVPLLNPTRRARPTFSRSGYMFFDFIFAGYGHLV